MILILTVLFPIFFTLYIGYFCRQRGILDDTIIRGANNLIYYILLPANLTNISWNSNFIDAFGEFNPIYPLISYLTVVLIANYISIKLKMENRKRITNVVGIIRCNAAFIGIPIAVGIFGKENNGGLAIALLFMIIISNVISTVLFSFLDTSKQSFFKITTSIFRNPLIVSLFIGGVLSILKVPYFELAEDSLTFLGKGAAPLALVLIGVHMNFTYLKQRVSYMITFVFFKLIALPLILLLLLSLDGSVSIVDKIAIILIATPTAVGHSSVTYIFKGDVEFADSQVVITTIFSGISLTLLTILLSVV